MERTTASGRIDLARATRAATSLHGVAAVARSRVLEGLAAMAPGDAVAIDVDARRRRLEAVAVQDREP